MACIYNLNGQIVCGRELTDGVHFPCTYCRNDEDGPDECEAEEAIGIRCHLFLDHTNRDMFPAYASAGTKAMDEIRAALFALITPTAEQIAGEAQEILDEMAHDAIVRIAGSYQPNEILRAAAHVLRMAKETGPAKMTTVLYLDQWASEIEKAEEKA